MNSPSRQKTAVAESATFATQPSTLREKATIRFMIGFGLGLPVSILALMALGRPFCQALQDSSELLPMIILAVGAIACGYLAAIIPTPYRWHSLEFVADKIALEDKLRQRNVEIPIEDLRLVLSRAMLNLSPGGQRVQWSGLKLVTDQDKYVLKLSHSRSQECFEALKIHCPNACFVHFDGTVSCATGSERLKEELPKIRTHLLLGACIAAVLAIPCIVVPSAIILRAFGSRRGTGDARNAGWLVIIMVTEVAGLAYAIRRVFRYLQFYRKHIWSA